jgi:hypothetical protein
MINYSSTAPGLTTASCDGQGSRFSAPAASPASRSTWKWSFPLNWRLRQGKRQRHTEVLPTGRTRANPGRRRGIRP